MKNTNEVVVTGLGMVCPIGVGLDSFVNSMLQGQSGVRVRPEFAETDWPFRIGAIVDDYDPRHYVKPRKSLKLMCREIQFGFGAARLAIEDAGIDFETVDPERVGVVCGSDNFYCDPASIRDSYISGEATITDLSRWIENAMKSIEPLWMLKYLPNMIASHIAISIDARGPNNSLMSGDASGVLSVIEAADAIRRGWADVMLAGGTGSKINPTYLAYHGIDHLAEPDEDPTRSCRPFDKNRTGSVAGEGAGMILLERRSHAEARGAKIYGTLAAADFGFGGVTPESRIQSFAARIERTIHRAGKTTNEITHLNSHGSGHIQQDAILAKAIANVLPQVPVTAYQSFFGNMGPAGATIELCSMLYSLGHSTVPQTINHEQADDECPVQVLTENWHQPQTAAIKTAESDTGQQVAVLFTAG